MTDPAPPQKLWVLLKSHDPAVVNHPVKVPTDGCTDVDDFIKAVKKELSPKLEQVSVDNITLHTTQDGPALEPDDALPTSNTKSTALVIKTYAFTTHSSSEHGSSIKKLHPARKRRWEELNEVLAQNKNKKATGSVGYSYVPWNDVKHIFRTTTFELPVSDIPHDASTLLINYLTATTKCFGQITTGKEAKRLHFIAPIIICVCMLFNGDVIIEVEEDLNGDFLKAHGHFEFVLRRGDKRVCIVEAKKEDFEQGMAQDLLGCEVAAELDNLDKVYGIVTNYIHWNFFCSLDDKIEMEERSLTVGNGGMPTPESLMQVAGKIYSMLQG